LPEVRQASSARRPSGIEESGSTRGGGPDPDSLVDLARVAQNAVAGALGRDAMRSCQAARRRCVLGIEEGRAYSAYGHAASIAPNPLSDAGIPTSLTLSPTGSVAVSHVIGGLPLPAGWGAIAAIEASGEGLRISGDGGSIDCPFDLAFLGGSG
jgi:hypothetical protein